MKINPKIWLKMSVMKKHNAIKLAIKNNKR